MKRTRAPKHKPGTEAFPEASTLEQKVRGLILDIVPVDERELTRDAKLMEDLGADSLDCVEIVMVLEEAFRIEIDDDVANELVEGTLGQMFDWLKQQGVKVKGAPAPRAQQEEREDVEVEP